MAINCLGGYCHYSLKGASKGASGSYLGCIFTSICRAFAHMKSQGTTAPLSFIYIVAYAIFLNHYVDLI
jgi:hypothetical protein